MKRKAVRVIIFVCLILCLAFWFWTDTSKDVNVEFLEKISGLDFPSKFEVLYSFDSGEYFCEIAFTGKGEELTAFARRNKMDSTNHCSSSSFIPFGMGLLGKYAPPDSFTTKSYFLLAGKNKNTWSILINPLEEKGWAYITYPDHGGD